MDVFNDRARNIAGKFAKQPDFLLLHGSRGPGDRRTMRQEFDATRRYCVTNGGGLAWHATIGEDMYSVHMPADSWGYHAYDASRRSIGIEFAQQFVIDEITDGQVRAVAHYISNYVLPVWPALNIARTGGMRAHSEIPEGKQDGKTDVFPNGDFRNDHLRERIVAALGGTGKPGTGGNGDGGAVEDLTIKQENKLFDDYLRALNARERAMLGPTVWRGFIFGREHWSGLTNTPALRLERGMLIITSGRSVVNATGLVIDDAQEHNRLRYRILN